jgi:hypothetical protein
VVKAGHIGLGLHAVGFVIAALPFVFFSRVFVSSGCGDGQGCFFPSDELLITLVGLLIAIVSAIAAMHSRRSNEISEEEAVSECRSSSTSIPR